MKYKLRNQIAFMFMATVLLSLTAIALINVFFLENYYVSKKTEVLKSVFEQLESFNISDTDISNELYISSAENNLTWVVVDSTLSKWKGYGQEKEGNQLVSRLFGYQSGLESEKSKEVLETAEEYTIQKCKDKFAGMDYVEMWGVMNNGNSFLIRSPLESIRESASISNMFFIYVGIITILFSGFVIIFTTKRLTQPISELTNISQKMAQLDFDARYNSHCGNEIDLLGENFNSMSSQLEKTITELKQANLELEKDIADKIKIDQMRKEFLDNVSHELKTPIALIQGYGEGLKDNITDDAESREFYCDVILDEANKMNIMVKKLLTLNQLESGQDGVTVERFDITELIRGVIQKSEILIQQKEAHVFFTGDEPIFVWADEFKIEEVMTNFFTNALNHVANEMNIEIKARKQDKIARISVFNTGTPIPQEDIENVWNKFYKVDKARTREYGGSGIGLSIVKAIMDSHQQKCGVNNYDNGVEFWFELNCD